MYEKLHLSKNLTVQYMCLCHRQLLWRNWVLLVAPWKIHAKGSDLEPQLALMLDISEKVPVSISWALGHGSANDGDANAQAFSVSYTYVSRCSCLHFSFFHKKDVYVALHSKPDLHWKCLLSDVSALCTDFSKAKESLQKSRRSSRWDLPFHTQLKAVAFIFSNFTISTHKY